LTSTGRHPASTLSCRRRATTRRENLPRIVWVSTLQRSLSVCRWLAQRGWQMHVDARLCELDFGDRDGHNSRYIA